MADPIQEMRLRKRFEAMNLGVSPDFPPQIEQDPQTRELPMDMTAPKVIAPTSTDVLRSTIQRMPSPEEYKPSTARRVGGVILGGIAGMGGHYNVGSDIVNAPFRRANEDWMQDYRRDKGSYDLDVEQAKQRKEIEDTTFERGIKGRQATTQEFTAETGRRAEDKAPDANERIGALDRRLGSAADAAYNNQLALDARNKYNQEHADKRTKDTISGADKRAADTDRRIRDEGAATRKNRLEAAGISAGKGAKISPQAQRSARAKALDLIESDPEFTQFVQPSSITKDTGERNIARIMTPNEIRGKDPSLSPQQAKDLHEHMKLAEKTYIRGSLKLAGMEDDEDDDDADVNWNEDEP